ncbi:Kelch-like protein 36 [Orchesella cincta]|uniref:Kelch-like protein 36 n=1 Tax=Orchesella cincta TaxID=48709 RepID=A0A1D2M8H6_ORCCI|nr:Kelch-like protein 36 [Orchesella cincta]
MSSIQLVSNMSVFLVKETGIGLKFSWRSEAMYSHTRYYLDVPGSADFKLVSEKLEQNAESEKAEEASNPKKRRRLLSLESFTLRFSRYCTTMTVTAFGAPLQRFIASRRNKKLQMNFRAKFHGFSIYCQMSSVHQRSPDLFGSSERNWFFEGTVSIDSSKVFKNDQLYTGRYSLEIMDRDVFEFGNMSDAQPKLKEFLEEATYSDFAIIADRGVRIPCHKVFLGVQSPVLDRMLQMDCKETREGCVKMVASGNGVKAFLKFLYYADLCDAFESPGVATELLELAHVYDVKPLEKALKTLFAKRADEWFDMDGALNLLICAVKKDGMEELKEKALRLIKSRKEELNTSSVFQEFLRGDPKEATELIKLLL